MSGTARFTFRLVRRVRAFIWRLFRSGQYVAWLFRAFRGQDILEVAPDGTVRVTRSSGPVPTRPSAVSNPSFTNPRTQRLARRAAVFLFDYFDFGAVPSQFWPVLEKTYDPGAAMDEFLRAVGCDPERSSPNTGLYRRTNFAEMPRSKVSAATIVREITNIAADTQTSPSGV